MAKKKIIFKKKNMKPTINSRNGQPEVSDEYNVIYKDKSIGSINVINTDIKTEQAIKEELIMRSLSLIKKADSFSGMPESNAPDEFTESFDPDDPFPAVEPVKSVPIPTTDDLFANADEDFID